MSNEATYLKVQKSVKAKKGFYFHFWIFVVLIIFLATINWLTAPDKRYIDWWVAFPAITWGTVVAIHALVVFIFSRNGVLGEAWEQQKIDTELQKRGYIRDNNVLSSSNEIDINDSLKLKKVERQTNYNEQDLV